MTASTTAVTTPAAASDGVRPAELDRRFYAYVVDRAIGWGLGAAAGLTAWVAAGVRSGLVLACVVFGVILVISVGIAVLQGLRGLTPGKAAAGIRTVAFPVDQPAGVPAGVVPALGRGLALGVAGIPTFFFGVACLAWTAVMDRDRRYRGWHDHRAGTLVVDVRPVPAPEDEPEAPQPLVNLTALSLLPQPPDLSPPDPPAPAPAPAAAPATPPAPVARWRLSFDSGESLVVEGLTLVGRGPLARAGEEVRHVVPLRSLDLSLSKTHIQIHPSGDGALMVTDRGSTNGSVLVRDGAPRELTAWRPVTVLDGDLVQLGDREMRVGREP